MTEWHELPADAKGYPGRTQLTRDGRTFIAMGIGYSVRQALEEKARQVKKGA